MMNDTVLLPKETYDALVACQKKYVDLLEFRIRSEERYKHTLMNHLYDPAYIQELAQRKQHVLKVLEQATREAILTSSLKMQP